MKPLDDKGIASELQPLAAWKRILFMTLCSERMLPNYRAFSAETGYGDAGKLREALDVVWDWLRTADTPENIERYRSICEQQCPSTTDFRSAYTSAALDAATAIAVTIGAIPDGNVDFAVEVAMLSRDTIDLFVQELAGLDPNSPSLESTIAESDLMQAEMEAQRQSLLMLRRIDDNRDAASRDMRLRWANRSHGTLPFIRH